MAARDGCGRGGCVRSSEDDGKGLRRREKRERERERERKKKRGGGEVGGEREGRLVEEVWTWISRWR